MTNATTTPDLRSYDWILVNSSAGKDSQAMLDMVVELATAEDVLERVVVVHCDLGRVEWAGTRELAEEQARHYGLRFEVVSRPQGDLLTQIEQRRMFPSASARYCTSDHKRGQVSKVLTALTTETNARRRSAIRGPLPKVRILNCMGLRADESPARAKKPAFTVDERATNGRRAVDTWLPIHGWTEAQVWARIKASGVRHHPAYDAGMPRLSCCFCVLASKSALVRAAQLAPGLAREYAAVEARIGHDFKQGLAMRDIIALADVTPTSLAPVEGWVA